MKKIMFLIALALLVSLNMTSVYAGEPCPIEEIFPDTNLDVWYIQKAAVNVWIYKNANCPVTVHYRPGWAITDNQQVDVPQGTAKSGTKWGFIKFLIFDWNNADASIMNTGLFQRVGSNEWIYQGSQDLALEYQPGFDISVGGTSLKPGQDAMEKQFRIIRKANKD